MNAEVLIVLVVIALALCSATEGYRYGTSCHEYKRAYLKLKSAIGTCQNANNYGCRVNHMMEPCDFRCIPMAQRCDGSTQCPLGDDEMNCPDTNSTPPPPPSPPLSTIAPLPPPGSTNSPGPNTSAPPPPPPTTTLPFVATEPCCGNG